MVVCGGVWWFAVVCGGLRWFVVDCGGLSFSHTAIKASVNTGTLKAQLPALSQRLHRATVQFIQQ